MLYTTSVHAATDGVWGLVEARMADMRLAEQQRLMEQGLSYHYAAYGAHRAMRGIENQISLIQEMTTSASTYARDRSALIRPDGAMLVADVTAHDIMGEFIRMREDVARRDYMTGAFQSGMGSVVIYMGGYSYSPHVYPTELSREYRADIVREGAQNGAMIVAEQLDGVLDEVMF